MPLPVLRSLLNLLRYKHAVSRPRFSAEVNLHLITIKLILISNLDFDLNFTFTHNP